MPHEPPPDEFPPPTGGGFKPLYPKRKIGMAVTGIYRVYGHPEWDCAAIVTYVNPAVEGEEYPTVNVTIFPNQHTIMGDPLHDENVPLWGMPGQPDHEDEY